MNVKKERRKITKILTTTNIEQNEFYKRNIKQKQNSNLNYLSSFKETNSDKNSQDLTPNNSTPSNTQVSPIQNKDDTNTQTETSINTFINLLSPNSQTKILCAPKNNLRLKNNTKIVTNFTNKNYINNTYIFYKITYTFKNIFILYSLFFYKFLHLNLLIF